MLELLSMLVQTGDRAKIWPFIGVGVAVAVLIVLSYLPKEKDKDDTEDNIKTTDENKSE